MLTELQKQRIQFEKMCTPANLRLYDQTWLAWKAIGQAIESVKLVNTFLHNRELEPDKELYEIIGKLEGKQAGYLYFLQMHHYVEPYEVIKADE